MNVAALKPHRPILKALIAARIDALVNAGPFDAMVKLARILPTEAISILVGLPEEGRSRMLDWAAATFNAIGPHDDAYDSDFKLLAETFSYVRRQSRETVREGSWAYALFDAVDAGRLSEAEARGALSAYVVPSLDTTILAKGHLLYLLASNLDQWRILRDDPSLIPNAVLESLRHSSVIRWFSRVAVKDYPVGGSVIQRALG